MKNSATVVVLNSQLKDKIRTESRRLSLTMAAYIRLVLINHLEGPNRDNHEIDSVLLASHASEDIK